ncbi:MAG: hypothetical protein J0M07_09045 [Anaerolineae bacterium]|nr:hypothetical protein [Anaerolineae bacterium]
MKKPMLLMLLLLLVAVSGLLVVSAQTETPENLLCTEDGSNGIQCNTVADNECFPGGDMAWESGNGPCEQGNQEVWVCGWYLARYNAGLISTMPLDCHWVFPPMPTPTVIRYS